MRQDELARGDPLRPLDWRMHMPFHAVATSDRLGWVGLEAARYRAAPASEINWTCESDYRRRTQGRQEGSEP